eukprot:GFKZ01005331.1.p1 GENE.GFKZ01005331.1~~GFKZ01005331.1.p1  ORF type:complete len:110 (-),score=0.45 GFKZ01005331.1:21-350(-)
MDFYARSSNLPICDRVHNRIRCVLRDGGHRFAPLAALNIANYAASLLDSEHVREQHLLPDAEARARTFGEADRHLLDFAHRLHPSFTTEFGELPESMSAANLAANTDNT